MQSQRRLIETSPDGAEMSARATSQRRGENGTHQRRRAVASTSSGSSLIANQDRGDSPTKLAMCGGRVLCRPGARDLPTSEGRLPGALTFTPFHRTLRRLLQTSNMYIHHVRRQRVAP